MLSSSAHVQVPKHVRKQLLLAALSFASLSSPKRACYSQGGGGLLGHSRRLSLTPSTRNLLVFLQRSRAAPELCGRVMAMAMAHSPRHIDVGYSETLYEFL